MKIQLSAPPDVYPNSIYLPYAWSLFKTYQECHYEKTLDVTWLDPIYLEEQTPVECDVFLISCYVWNWHKNLEFARRAKELNPNCIVIAGGPQVPYKDPNVWDLYENVDVICFQEGERIICEYLYCIQNNLNPDIDGVLLRESPNKQPVWAPKLKLEEIISPWKHCFDDLKRFSDVIHSQNKRVVVALETNRGCPYKCSFCDWGMDTNSKIRLFAEDIVKEGIRYIIDLRPSTVYIVDANYGSFQHDLDYIKMLVEGKQTKNYPQMVTFAGAKNNKKTVNASYKLLYDNKMITMAQIGFQHTDPEVLANIDRDNIKDEKFMEEMQESFNAGIPVVGFLILGNPGDTIYKWKKAWSDLFSLGFNEDVKVSDFFILPNAPAAQPEYMEKYKIKTHIRSVADQVYNRNLIDAELIVETYSFNKQDYAEMQLYSAFIQGTHILNITKFPALIMHHNKGMSYLEFYDRLLEFKSIKPILDRLRKQIDIYLTNDNSNKFIQLDGEPSLYEDYIYIECLKNINEIYIELYDLLSEYFEKELVDDIITFSLNTHTGLHSQKLLKMNHDMIDYFSKVLNQPPGVLYNEDPVKTPVMNFITDRRLGVYKNIDFDTITSLSDIRKKILRASNFRHRTTYFPSLFYKD
jgi:putative methyltransferase